jgi:hypothetical protein
MKKLKGIVRLNSTSEEMQELYMTQCYSFLGPMSTNFQPQTSVWYNVHVLHGFVAGMGQDFCLSWHLGLLAMVGCRGQSQRSVSLGEVGG